MEANTMSPDQTAPQGTGVHIVCNIARLSKHKQLRKKWLSGRVLDLRA